MSHHSLTSRALMTAAATTALAVGALVGSAPAFAHVHVDADDPVQGDSAIVTFQVPNESDSGSPTTALTRGATEPDLGVHRRHARLDGQARPRRRRGHRPVGHLVRRAEQRDRRRPVRPVRASGQAPRQPHRQLPGHPDVRRRHSRALGPAAAAGRRRARTSCAHADAGSGGGRRDPSKSPSTRASRPLAETTAATPAPAAAAAAQPGNGHSQGPDNVARVLAGGALLVAALGVALALARRRA